MGSQGKVLALLQEERDALAAWMLMKRGCRAIAMAEGESSAVRTLRLWDPDLKVVPPGEIEPLVQRHKVMAVVSGWRIPELERKKPITPSVPVFYPLVGMSEEEVRKRLHDIQH